MARRYAIIFNGTGTASATLPLATLISTTAIRPCIYDIILSSQATPADNYADYVIQRCTTAGTAGSAWTPVALDNGDPASTATSGLATFSAGPTLTANAYLLRLGVNQRASFRWVAAPGSELKIPATANNGLALMCLNTNSAFVTDATILFEE